MKMQLFFPAMLLFANTLDVSAQVSLQTGASNYTIPIFSYNDAKAGLSTSVSLNYNSAGGLKVSDVATSVGTGWALTAGGYIQRQQIGEPDDQNSEILFPKKYNCNSLGFNQRIALAAAEASEPGSIYYIDNYYPNGFAYSEFSVGTDYMTCSPAYCAHSNCNVPRELAVSLRFRPVHDKRWKLSRRALADREQDKFIFYFNGRAGEFVLGKDGNILVLQNSKLIVTKVEQDLTPNNIRTKISSFTITDEMGIKYKFSAYQLSAVSNVVPASNPYSDVSMLSSQASGKYVIDKWWLSEVENPLTGSKIFYYYTDETVSKDHVYSASYGKIDVNSPNSESTVVYSDNASTNNREISWISFPDGHTVQFEYAAGERHDLKGAHHLDEIKINYIGNPVNRYKLECGYFVKKAVKLPGEVLNDEKRFARLMLKSVQKFGTDNEKIPPYQFEYYTGAESADEKEIVPPQHTFAQDMWGFYNKASNISLTDIIPAKAVMKELFLNPAVYRECGNATAKLGLLKSVKQPEGGTLEFEYEQNQYTSGMQAPTTFPVGGVRVSKTTFTDDVSSANNIVQTYEYKTADGKSSLWGYEAPENHITKVLRYFENPPLYNYSEGGNEARQAFSALAQRLLINSLKAIAKNFLPAIAGNITVTPTPEIIFFWYVAVIVIPSIQLLLNPSDDFADHQYTFYPVWHNNPLQLQYARATVKTTGANAGAVVYEFSAPQNQQTELPPLAFPYSNKPRMAPWQYGLPVKTIFLNEAGATVKEVINNYSIIKSTYQNDAYRSVKIEPLINRSVRCEYGTGTIPVTDFSYDFYYPVTGRTELNETVEKEYTPGGLVSEFKTNYYYNPLNYQLKQVVTVNSRNDLKGETIYYTNDYTIPGVIQTMKNMNILNMPVTTVKWIQKAGTGNKLVTDMSVSEYDILSNGDIKPAKLHTLSSAQPVVSTLPDNVNPAVLISLPQLQPSVEFKYKNSNIESVKSLPGNKISGKIYDYGERFATATVNNADASEVAYSSFEAQNKGNWSYSDNAVISSSESVTGDKCFTLTGNGFSYILETNIVMNKKYVLSFWAKNGVLNVNGSVTLKISGPVINGWTYYEYEVAQGAPAPSITGTGLVDELRLYPQNAQMTTCTYNPVKGKTSECDENNRVTYFEYDGLGRVVKTRDAYRNILKTIEYHYKNN